MNIIELISTVNQLQQRSQLGSAPASARSAADFAAVLAGLKLDTPSADAPASALGSVRTVAMPVAPVSAGFVTVASESGAVTQAVAPAGAGAGGCGCSGH